MALTPSTTIIGATTEGDGQSAYKIKEGAMGVIVIFGATGDLASRKLMPAIYNLWAAGFLPKKLAVLGVGRKQKPDNEFREEICEGLKKHSRTGYGSDDTCDPFVRNLYYHALDFSDGQGYAQLRERVEALEAANGLPRNRLHYLATAAEYFSVIIDNLGASGLALPNTQEQWTRVVVEKPFGHDLASARALNERILTVLAEDQIYRIDHYLGKETVQNIFSFRFGNAIFEPLFNQKYVDHVQITVAETVGMEGRRGEFYDKTGALRDVIQNHALQLLCIVAMEPPASMGAKEIHDEKVKVLTSVSLPKKDRLESWVVRGQYTEGSKIPGYLSEEGVAGDSTTETYVALRMFVDNWRWAGVPFFMRTGKHLKTRATEILVQFKHPPMRFFEKLGITSPEANQLVFRIQPDEGISLSFTAKAPGMGLRLLPVNMNFVYDQSFAHDLPDAYERLLLDALRGDSTLFTRADEIESAWRIVSEIRDAWDGGRMPELYRPGTWGPSAANRMMEVCQGEWQQPE